MREKIIIRKHSKVASLCDNVVSEYLSSSFSRQELPLISKMPVGNKRIIWQYWGQGFVRAPKAIQECCVSVDRWCGDYEVIRLDDDNFSDYIGLPPFLLQKKAQMSRAHFSDVLRLCLLYLYGGLWLDASVYLTGPIPDYVFAEDFFAFQRDAEEPNKEYWKHVYAYYFGWADGFRVNVLNSVLQSRKGAKAISSLCGVMLFFWRQFDEAPDYFFFQIMFDVMVHGCLKNDNCIVRGDCKIHYLQQLINDPNFKLATKSQILEMTPIHKMTYKN